MSTAPAKPSLARLTKLFNYEKYTCQIKRGTRYFYSHNSGAYRRGAGTRTPVRSALATTHAGGARSGHEGGRVNHAGLQAQYVLYKQDALDAPGQVLLDPNTLAADGTTSLSTYALTDGGDLLAYGVSQVCTPRRVAPLRCSPPPRGRPRRDRAQRRWCRIASVTAWRAQGGSDWVTVRVRDVATATDLPDTLHWVKFSGLAWTDDNKGFFYSVRDSHRTARAVMAQTLTRWCGTVAGRKPLARTYAALPQARGRRRGQGRDGNQQERVSQGRTAAQARRMRATDSGLTPALAGISRRDAVADSSTTTGSAQSNPRTCSATRPRTSPTGCVVPACPTTAITWFCPSRKAPIR